MENYIEVNAILELIKELKALLEDKRYLAALFLTLTIPDSLGKVAYHDIDNVKERYIKWFDENVINFFGLLYSDPFYKDRISFTGKICYQLRCSLLHESTDDISEKTDIKEFVLGFNDQRFFTGATAGNEYVYVQCRPGLAKAQSVNYLYVGVKEICTDLLEAAERFVAQNPSLDYPKLKINYGGGKASRFIFPNQKKGDD